MKKKIFNNEDNFYNEQEFSKIDFSEQSLTGAEFYKCIFSDCNLYKAQFVNCQFEDCTFRKGDLSLISFKESQLMDVKFYKTKIIGVDWTILKKPYRFAFDECKLDNSSFFKMELINFSIVNSSAREVDFIEASLSKAVFSGTDFQNSRFARANLFNADFTNAYNYNIDPNNCKLKKTIFSMPEALSLLNAFDIIIK